MDHAQWKKWILFVAVDALSKWPEVFIVNSTSASQTIDKLRTVFATHGLPVTLVSYNGPPFSSASSKSLCVPMESCTEGYPRITHNQMGWQRIWSNPLNRH